MSDNKGQYGWLNYFPSKRVIRDGPSEPVQQPDSRAGAPGVWSGAARRRMRKGAGSKYQGNRERATPGAPHTLLHLVTADGSQCKISRG